MTICEYQYTSDNQEHISNFQEDNQTHPSVGQKRKISDVSEDAFGNTRAAKRHCSRMPTMCKRIDKPHIITRDDAFQLGLRHTNKKVNSIIDNMSNEELDELELTNREIENEPTHTEKILNEKECQEIENVGMTYSESAASQLLEITAICKLASRKYPKEAHQVLEFARKIIQTLPAKKTHIESDTLNNTSEEYINIARTYFEKVSNTLGIIIPEKSILEYAAKLQDVAEKGEDELIQENDEEALENREYEVTRTLGNLLYIADKDVSIAASCLSSTNLDVCRECLVDKSRKVLNKVKEEIDEHHTVLINTAIHNIKQSLNHFTCIKMANELLLSNGSFNHGMIDDIFDALIPEELESTEAIKNGYYLLGNIASNALLAERIYNAKVPKDKNLPSNDLVRATLNINRNKTLRNRDVQITILSALLENVRQAKAGSCFATSWLISLLFNHTEMIVGDYTESIIESSITRRIYGESKTIPFQLRTSREGLDVTLTIDNNGFLISKECYDKSPDEMKNEPMPTGKAYIWEVPGIKAACQALGYNDAEGIVTEAIKNIGSLSFTSKKLLEVLANLSFLDNKRNPYITRSIKELSIDELISIAQYAFGVQTRHALHSAWEQMAAASVIYLASQFAMSLWVYESLKESIHPKPTQNSDRATFLRYRNKLMENMLLPMISRMRYRYNHYLEEDKKLFDGNKGVHGIGFYGYELCDTGLPEDFKYSTDIAKQIKAESTYFHYTPFKGYPDEHSWKKVSKDSFQSFIIDVLNETVNHLKSQETGPNRKNNLKVWDDVAQQFTKRIQSPAFLRKITTNLFGKYYRNEQRKEFRVNEFTCQSTPWLLRWGGSPEEVIKSLYGYKDDLVGMHKYSGGAESVLAWRINYARKQPDFIKEQFDNYYYMTVVVNPPHAFLFRPGLKRFQEAIQSNLPAPKWIQKNIIEPGKNVANSRMNIRERNTLIDFVANSEWVRPSFEKEDLERQELTEYSKNIFDEQLEKGPDLYKLTLQEFKNSLFDTVSFAREADPKIGKRYPYWEKRLEICLKNKILQHLPNASWDKKVPRFVADNLIEYARNRKDVMAFSEPCRNEFLRAMRNVPYGYSCNELREAIVKECKKIRYREMGINRDDKKWLEKITESIDNKIFELLDDGKKDALVKSGLLTDDTNWSNGVHAYFFMWVVNPGTGKLELARYNKDQNKIEFLEQKIWFPKKKGYYWYLPKNYITFKDAPAFNVRKYTGI